MAVSGLPKLADFKKAIADVKAANTKYTTAQNSLKPSQEAIDKAKSALDTAKEKFNTLQRDYDNKSYLNNSTYQSASDTYKTAQDKATSLENYWRSRDWLKSDSGYQNAANTYNTLKESLDSGKYLQNNSAYQTAANNLTAAQQKLETAKNYLNSEDYLSKNSTYQNLLSARQTAEQKLNEAREFYDSGRYYRDNSTYNNNVNAFNDADRKLNDLRNWKDSGRYLEENSTYKNAVNAIESKINALREAENKLDNWSGNRSGSAWNSAVSAKVAADNAVSAAYSARDKAAEAASNAADTLIRNQDTAKNTAEQNVNKTRESLEVAANKARETAENTFNTVRENIDRTKDTLRETAEKAVNTAQSAYENAQPAADKAKETATNAARAALGTAETNRNIAENKADELAWGTWQNSAKAADALNTKANDIAKGLEATANKVVEAQKSAVDTQNGLFETAQNKYNDIYGQLKPDLEDYNAKVADLSNYAQTFKENIGDITKSADATAAKNLLQQFNSEIKNSGIQELQEKVLPLFSGIDPTYKVTPIALQGANASLFSNIDPTTGLPLLNRDNFDSIVARYGNNVKGNGKARAAFAQEGWNMMSDSALLLQGPAILGLSTGSYHDGTGGIGSTTTGIVNSKGLKATDNDYLTAAKQIGLDGDSYTMPIKFVPAGYAYGQVEKPTSANSAEYTNPRTGETYLARINPKTKEFEQALDTKALYADISEKTKDLYYVANAIENVGANKATPHAGILYKANESGVLTPVLNEKNEPIVNYYEGERVHHAGASGQLAELMPLIQIASMVFAPQLSGVLNSAIGGIQVSAAVAPTAFTMGLPAVTLAQTIGATGVSMIAGAVQNAVTSGLMGGDIGKAALSGAISPAFAGNANKILENVGIGQDSIAKIAAATNLSAQQVTNLMANGLTVGVTGAVLGDPNALENALTSTAGQFTGYQAQNLVYDTLKSADPKVLAATANAAGNVANIATQTTINGGDVSLALQNAMPSIIADAAQAGNAVKTDKPTTTTPSSTTKPDVIAGLTPEQVGQNEDNEFNLLGKKSPNGNQIVIDRNNNLFELTEDDIIPYVNEAGAYITTGKVDKNGNEIVEGPNGFYVRYKSKNLNELGYQNTFDVPYDPETEALPIGSLFSFGTPPPPNVANKISLVGSGSTSTIDENKFGIVAQDYGTPEEKLKAIADVENWEKSIQNDPKATAEQKTKAADITKAIRDANVTATRPEVQQPVVTPPAVTPTPVKPTDVKPDTTTTAGGSSTAAPTPEPTPQQKVDELQRQADAAQAQVLNAANEYIKNPTVENKAKANASVLNYELAGKIADAAKADLVSKPEIPLPKDGGSAANQPAGAPSGSQQTGAQQPTQTPGTQQPAQPGVPQPAQPGTDQPSTSTTPGSGTSNLPGTSTTAGLGGAGTGGTGTTGNGAAGSGTGTGTGVGPGTDITGILSALAGALGGGKVPTVGGGLGQVPTGFTAVTTPLAKRPIGDLYPVSHTMMTPEEIAARSTTQMVRRGGLVSR